MKRGISLISAVFLFAGAASVTIAQNIPSPISSSTNVNVDPHSGSAGFSVPIEVPSGRGGIQPNLAIGYNSSLKNGPLGVGWTIELGSIQRSTKNGYPRYDNQDTFLLLQGGSNQELVYDATNDVYHPEIEGSFMRIKHDTTNEMWVVTDKKGTKYFFGQTDNSRERNPTQTNLVFKWCLNRVEDVHGNYMTIDYQRDSEKLYPQYIRYTGNVPQSLSTFAQVEFILEARPDTSVNHITSFRRGTDKRVSDIKVSVDANLQRRYHLDYTTSATTHRSLLTSVTQFGSDDVTSLPPITFTYQNQNGTSNPTHSLSTLEFPPPKGDNLWNMRFAHVDHGHNNVYNLYPFHGSNKSRGQFSDGFSFGWGPTYTQSSYSDSSRNWSIASNGNLVYNGVKDTEFHGWTYLYMRNSKNIPLPQTHSADVGDFFFNGAYNNPRRSGTFTLQKGYNRIDVTGYNQNSGNFFRLNYALGSEVHMMNSEPVGMPTLSGDFNGDGRADIANYIKSTRTLTVARSTDTGFSEPEVLSGAGSLLLHANAPATTTSFTDEAGHTINVVGHTQHHATAQMSNSIIFDGSGDYLWSPNSVDWDIMLKSDDNWTIDLWVKHASASASTQYYLSQFQNAALYWELFYDATNGVTFKAKDGTLDMINISGGTITDTNWHHIAVAKKGRTFGIYLDGVQKAYGQFVSNVAVSADLIIGARGNQAQYFTGNLDEIHIMRGDKFGADPKSDNSDTITKPTSQLQRLPANSEIQLGDFNADGKTDVVAYETSKGHWHVALSNGGTLEYKGIWGADFGPNQQPVTGDFNGDGYTDIGYIYTSGSNKLAKIYRNNRIANFTDPFATDPIAGTTSHQVFTADFNGDGLTDFGAFDKNTGHWITRLNTGNLAGEYEVFNVIPSYAKDKDMVISDVNSDGLPDIGFFEPSTKKVLWRASNGTPTPAGQRDIDFSFTIANDTTQVQSSDFNGDGITDFAAYNALIDVEAAHSATGVVPDLLFKIDNSIGGVTLLSYDSSTSVNNEYLPFPVPIVDIVTRSNSLGDTYTTNYEYDMGKWDPTKREFRGFGTVKQIDPEGNYTETHFMCDDIFKGRVSEQGVYDSSDNLFSKTVNTWDKEQIIPGVNFVFLKRRDNYVYDGDSTGRRTAEEYFYQESPQYGNLTKTVQLGEVELATGNDVGNDKRSVETTYHNNTSGGVYLLSIPKQTIIKNDSGAQVRMTSYFYDGASNINTIPMLGLLTQKENWAGNGATTHPRTKYTYDVYGNLKTTIDPLDNVATITYDTGYQMFPLETENASTHKVVSQYYGVNGVPLSGGGFAGLWGQLKNSKDPNNQSGSKVYDVFGRNIATISPLDSITHPTTTISFTLSATNIKVTSSQRVKHGTVKTIDAVQFIDGLGRVIQSKRRSHQANQYVVQGQMQYNSRGLAEKQYLPYFTTNDLNTIDPLNITKPHSIIDYDKIGRVIKKTNPDASYSTVVYDDWLRTTINENGHQQKSEFDAYGRLVKKIEYKGADGRSSHYTASTFTPYATTLYEYDSEGNLTKVTDAKNNVTTISYDNLGQKASTTDPDMGIWSYKYDLNGNMIEQTDARGQKLEFDYDVLDRLKNKKDSLQTELLVDYFYDDLLINNSKGRLTKVQYGSQDKTQFEYDALGREIKSTKTIDNVNYNVERGYDALNNIINIEYPNQEDVFYEYNDAGQIKAISNDATLLPGGGASLNQEIKDNDILLVKSNRWDSIKNSFAVVGGLIEQYVFGVSPAYAQSANFNQVLEAENMPTKTTGQATSGGWNIYTNGYIEESVTFPETETYEIAISAKGSYGGGAWPNMQVRINQSSVANITVNTSDWSAYSTNVTVAAGAKNVAAAFTNDYNSSTEDRNLYVDKIVITKKSTQPAFQQDSGSDGIVSIEVENFHEFDTKQGDIWVLTSQSGYSGTGALQALVNNGTKHDTAYEDISSQLDYKVKFVKTGTHYIWARGMGAGVNDDSYHVGVNGGASPSSDRITGFGTSWTWSKATMDTADATINIATAGEYAINAWMREDGFVIDKIVITTNANYTPTGTGPAESPRGTGAGPSAPTLNNPTVGDQQVSLSWNAVTGATGYKVKYGTSTGNHPTVIDVGNVTSRTVTGLTNNTIYYFVVTAYDASSGESPKSNEKSAEPMNQSPPNAPTLDSANPGDQKVTLTWSPVGAITATGYKVKYGTTSGTHPTVIDVGNVTSREVTGLTNNTAYYFVVTAYNINGESAKSNELSATPLSSLPSPWVSNDIGNVGPLGSAIHSNGTFTLKASGADIWNTADAFHYMYQPLSGDGQIVARVDSVSNTHSWAKAGVMIRNSLAANSQHAMMAVTASEGTSFQRRLSSGGSSASTGGGTTLTAPYWIKIVRAGNSFTAHQSADGNNWSQVGTAVSITMGTDVYIGTALTSHNNTALNTSVFSNVSVTTGSAPSAPTLNSASPGDQVVGLSWGSVSTATGYKVKYGTVSGTHPTVIDVGNVTSRDVTGLTNNTTYYFVATAYNANGESIKSNELSATPQGSTPPSTPTLNTATPGNQSVNLDWGSVATATGYKVSYFSGTSSSGTNYTQDTACVGAWKLNGSTGAVADSCGSSAGAITNPVERGVTGKIGDAFLFLGSSSGNNAFVNFGSHATLDNLSARTAVAWILPNSLGDNNQGVILSKNTQNGWGVSLWPNNKLRFFQAFSGGTVSWETPTNSISLASWNHIAVTYAGSSTTDVPKIYINGVSQTVALASSAPFGTFDNDAAYDLKMGIENTTYEFAGTIDEAGVFNRILTSTEINELKDKGLDGTNGGGTPPTVVDVGNVTTHNVTGLTNSTLYNFSVKAYNTHGESALSNQLTATPQGSAGAFQQSSGADGIVSMEAESFDTNTPQGNHSWITSSQSGYSGTSAMTTTPNNNTNNNTGYTTNSPRLNYQVNFVKTGTHYVWARGIGATGSDDSYHAGIDGAANTSSDRISTFNTSWTWSKATMDNVDATINVASTGAHTINVWMREDGFVIDKIVITTNANYTPTGMGPAESPRGNAPSAPSQNNPTPGNAQVQLNWDAVSGATGYKVKYGVTTGNYGTPIDVNNVTSHTISGLTNNTTYYFVVTAYNTSGESANSNEKSAIPINQTTSPTLFIENVEYNASGQITKIEYGNGVDTTYTYDPLSLRLKKIYSENATQVVLQDLNYTYDSAGNILSITDNVHTADQTFEYDEQSRLTKAIGQTYGTKNYAYDEIGNITSKDGFTYTYGQNGAGPHAVTTRTNGNATTTFTYDANGNMATLSEGSTTTTYAYDLENQLVKVSKNSSVLAEYEYDGDGGRTKKKILSQGGSCFLAGTQVLMIDGTTKSIEDIHVGDQVMAYDEETLSRIPQMVLNTFTNPAVEEYLIINDTLKVTPDHKFYVEGEWRQVGNLSVNDVLLSEQLGEITINKIERVKLDKYIEAYDIEVENDHNYFVQTSTHTSLDKLDEIPHAFSGVTFVLVHNQLTPPGGNTNSTTVYVGSLYEEEGLRKTSHIFMGSVRVASITNSNVMYLHQDHLGGANILTNDQGVKKELTEYKPYGERAKHEKYGSTQEVARYYFTGKEFDDEVGLYYYGARYYNPKLGRFITPDTVVQDPAGNPQTLNRYSYVGNNPINHVDPTGNFFKKLWKSFVGALIGAIVGVLTFGAGFSLAAAGFFGGATAGAITGGLNNGWQGALMGGLIGGLTGAFGGWGVDTFGAGFGVGLLAVGAGVAGGTGGLEGLAQFGAGVAGSLAGAFIGNSILNARSGRSRNVSGTSGEDNIQATLSDEFGNVDKVSLKNVSSAELELKFNQAKDFSRKINLAKLAIRNYEEAGSAIWWNEFLSQFQYHVDVGGTIHLPGVAQPGLSAGVKYGTNGLFVYGKFGVGAGADFSANLVFKPVTPGTTVNTWVKGGAGVHLKYRYGVNTSNEMTDALGVGIGGGFSASTGARHVVPIFQY